MEKVATAVELHSLYRRLRRVGESQVLIRRVIRSQPRDQYVDIANDFLKRHADLATLNGKRRVSNFPSRAYYAMRASKVRMDLRWERLVFRNMTLIRSLFWLFVIPTIISQLYGLYWVSTWLCPLVRMYWEMNQQRQRDLEAAVAKELALKKAEKDRPKGWW